MWKNCTIYHRQARKRCAVCVGNDMSGRMSNRNMSNLIVERTEF